MHIEYHDTLPSTNQYCELLDLTQVEEFTVIAAHQQTAGIGQRGNHWTSDPGENLTFSIILHPTFLPIASQYQLTKAISLGITDFLSPLIPSDHKVSIKWPNDIYVDHCKICGTLITNKICGATISTAIVGIGININQTAFPQWVPNPTSLSLLTNRRYQTEELLPTLVDAIQQRYLHLKDNPTSPDTAYLSQLLNLGTPARYLYQEREITATILGVNHFGHLQLRLTNGEEIVCQLKEIKTIF